MSFRYCFVAGGLWVALPGCSLAPAPTADAPPVASKQPGRPFDENICFRCALRSCSGTVQACLQEATCSSWLNCVAACPTDESGVAAEGSCLRRCGLPVSAQVAFGCIQDFATGFLLGCEEACEPP